jgi:hypothetical protein
MVGLMGIEGGLGWWLWRMERIFGGLVGEKYFCEH